jgi:hypothetical protein
MSTTIVRYRVAPGRTEENATLVRAVYSELAATEPPGFRYATYLEDDGVSFVHIAITDGDHDAPLPQLPAFQRYRRRRRARRVAATQVSYPPSPSRTTCSSKRAWQRLRQLAGAQLRRGSRAAAPCARRRR